MNPKRSLSGVYYILCWIFPACMSGVCYYRIPCYPINSVHAAWGLKAEEREYNNRYNREQKDEEEKKLWNEKENEIHEKLNSNEEVFEEHRDKLLNLAQAKP